MKKLGILVLLILGVLSFRTQVTYTENASYPFKAITIVEATTFKVVVAEGIQESSLLYGLVTPGEIITIYVAQIFFTEMNGEINNSPSYVLIVSNAVDDDLVRYIINSSYNNPGVEEYQSFASHILIDAEVGVYKDFDGIDPVYGMRHLTVHHIIEGDQYIFMDNNKLEMPMIEGSYQFETDLEIFISVNESNA